LTLRAKFSGAAARYDEAAVLARETGRRMAERLDFVRLTPRRIADIGCATGDGVRALAARYPQALPLAVDYALPMLREVSRRASWLERLRGRAPQCVGADVGALPLAADSLDLLWSNLMLHWLADPLPALREMHRVLAVDGLLMFAALGPDTLKELRAAGATTLARFHDMHDLGDMLVAAGFADPVMDMEMIEFNYASPRGLLRDQRQLGVRDALLGPLSFRDGRRLMREWVAQHPEGALPASFEIVFGHAWKAPPRQAGEAGAPQVITLHRR
jgi:malonyl-CoA O-methyltransferase